MEQLQLLPAQDALTAVKGIAEDVLASGTALRRATAPPLSVLDLAIGLRRMQHAEFVHYLRCNASREALELIVRAVELAAELVKNGDRDLLEALVFGEPYRHHLYASVTRAALLAYERDATRREMARWQMSSSKSDRDHPNDQSVTVS